MIETRLFSSALRLTLAVFLSSVRGTHSQINRAFPNRTARILPPNQIIHNMQFSSQVSPSQMGFKGVSPPPSCLSAMSSVSDKPTLVAKTLDSFIDDWLLEPLNRANLLPQNRAEGRPLFKLQYLTRDYPGKKQPARLGLPLPSFVLDEAGCLRLEVSRACPAKQGCSSELQDLKSFPWHVPLARPQPMTVAQTVFAD
jgi:hypothetical protein